MFRKIRLALLHPLSIGFAAASIASYGIAGGHLATVPFVIFLIIAAMVGAIDRDVNPHKYR